LFQIKFFNILTLTIQPHQKIRFLEIFWVIFNMFAIVSNLQKKKIDFSQNRRFSFCCNGATKTFSGTKTCQKFFFFAG